MKSKSTSDILNILLQVLDDGRLTDNKGHVVSLRMLSLFVLQTLEQN